MAKQGMGEGQSAYDGFAEFYNQNYDTIYKYVYHVFQNKYVAEDITQEAFYTAFLKQGELWKHSNPRSWLLRIARYKMLEFSRKLRYREVELLEQDNPQLAQEDFRFHVKELELAASVTIGEREWWLMKKYYLFGSTISELAEAEGITENNMRVRLSRWAQRLRNGIKG